MSETLIAIDAGTTNTRAWLVDGEKVYASDSVAVGVRDTARDGHPQKLISGLRDLVASVRSQSTMIPTRIAAAGMITSSLGLREIVHQLAPAGPRELADGAVELHMPEISDLPIVLFPGVRSGSWFHDEDVESIDMMRGEETLCLGLASARPGHPLTVLNLGSHWKGIQIDARGNITGSWTTLSGEMLHAVMTQTILASAVPAGRPEAYDCDFGGRGMEMCRRHGLSRSLFAVRLWEVQASAGASPLQRLSYLVGIFVAEAFDVFRRAGYFTRSPVILVGGGGIADAWQELLRQERIEVELVDSDAAAQAFIQGIRQLMAIRL